MEGDKMIVYDIDPVAKPRMTKSDRWKKRPATAKYWAFKDKVRQLGIKYDNGYSITFVIPMPKSWSKKKKESMCRKPHQQKPDADNLVKALLDAIFDEDKHIWHLGEIKKIWGGKGAIIIFKKDVDAS
jgi:Holliday junction resolvase RusA-like endonuclease